MKDALSEILNGADYVKIMEDLNDSNGTRDDVNVLILVNKIFHYPLQP